MSYVLTVGSDLFISIVHARTVQCKSISDDSTYVKKVYALNTLYNLLKYDTIR